MAISTTIKMVQGDQRPKRVITLVDENEAPVDLAVGGVSLVRMHMREVGGTTLKTTVPCTILSGLTNADGTVTYTAPYDIAGKGGRVQIDWTAAAVDTPGQYEGEFEILFTDSSTQTTYLTTKINVREQIG